MKLVNSWQDRGSAHRKAATYTGQHKARKTLTHVHASSGIRIHDPGVLAREDISCLRPRGHCKQLVYIVKVYNLRANSNRHINNTQFKSINCIRNIKMQGMM
jgi:hypothetical protein